VVVATLTGIIFYQFLMRRHHGDLLAHGADMGEGKPHE
jgi:hypothetical protein